MSEKIKKATKLFFEFHKKFHNLIVECFERLASQIVRHYWWFILIPVLFTCIGTSALLKLVQSYDYESLTLPDEGVWSDERKAVEENFGHQENKSSNEYFNALRVTSYGQYLNVLVASDLGDDNILKSNIWNDITELNDHLTSFIIYEDGGATNFSYEDICSKWKGKCFPALVPIRPDKITAIASLLQVLPEIFRMDNVSLPAFIPVMQFYIGYNLGNPNFTRQGYLASADAISLFYWLQGDTEEDRRRSYKWQKVALTLLSNNSSRWKNLKLFPHASRTPSDEMHYVNESLKPMLALSGFFMVIFVIASASMSDWVRSKIILSLFGIVSVIMATGTAFGILSYCRVPFLGINYATIFLMLGIGIDDMFVLLAAWRLTPIQDSVEKRMKATYGHACLSVTMTSLTNGLAFFVGTFTRIRIIEIFSIYSCLSVLLTYLYFMTFFGGCLVIAAYIEKGQRHSVLFCIKVLSKSKSESKHWFYRWFMSGGIDSAEPYHPLDNQPHLGMSFAKKILGKSLANNFVKGFCCLLYVVYVIIVSYGISKFEMGSSPNRVFFQTETARYFDKYDLYFSGKPTFVQIILTEELDYGNSSVQNEILNLHDKLEELPFVRQEFTISWLKDWIHFTRKHSQLLSNNSNSFVQLLKKEITDIGSVDASSCTDAMQHIRDTLMAHSLSLDSRFSRLFKLIRDIPCTAKQLLAAYLPNEFIEKQKGTVDLMSLLLWTLHQISQTQDMYELDVVFDAKSEKIEASRFLIVVDNGSDPEIQQSLRRIVKESAIPGVKVFNMLAFVADEVEVVKETTIRSTLSTTLVVVLISLLLIPNPSCSLWVSASIASIEFGVVGLMSLWGVQLNAVSMVNLIMCVGFSVDFSAHISYAFLSSPGDSVDERVEMALYAVGIPILMGGMSTIVGILPICFSESIIFIIFFKIVFIVVSLGMLHALVFLPVFMSVFDLRKHRLKSTKSDSSIAMGTKVDGKPKIVNGLNKSNIISTTRFDSCPEFNDFETKDSETTTTSSEIKIQFIDLRKTAGNGVLPYCSNSSYAFNTIDLDDINQYESHDV